jgi:predicted DNA-binding protein (MmcQ/YjbR family)
MNRAAVNAACAALAGAEHSHAFGPGHDVWKVGGKIFAIIGAEGGGVSIKTPDIESASLLIAAGVALRAPYLHRSWVLVPFDAADGGNGAMPRQELEDRIRRSHRIVADGLSLKMRSLLGV